MTCCFLVLPKRDPFLRLSKDLTYGRYFASDVVVSFSLSLSLSVCIYQPMFICICLYYDCQECRYNGEVTHGWNSFPPFSKKKNKKKRRLLLIFVFIFFDFHFIFCLPEQRHISVLCRIRKKEKFFFFSLLCDTLEVTLSHSIFTSFFVSFACNTILYSFICCVYFVGDAFFLSRGINTSEIDAKLFCFLFLLLCVQVYK